MEAWPRLLRELADDAEFWFVTVAAHRSDPESGALVLELSARHDDGTLRTIEVRAEHELEHRFAGGEVCVALAGAEHPLVRRLVDPVRMLHFRGKPRSTGDAVVELLDAHREAAGKWIPVEAALNSYAHLRWLLEGDFGLLASGPAFLVEAYARVLEEHGVSATLSEPRPARSWNGSTFVDTPRDLVALILDGDPPSWVVARELAARELPRRD